MTKYENKRFHFPVVAKSRLYSLASVPIPYSVEMERYLDRDLYRDGFAVQLCGLKLPTLHGTNCLLIEVLAYASQNANVTGAPIRFHIHAQCADAIELLPTM